jgi:hypothetical protein
MLRDISRGSDKTGLLQVIAEPSARFPGEARGESRRAYSAIASRAFCPLSGVSGIDPIRSLPQEARLLRLPVGQLGDDVVHLLSSAVFLVAVDMNHRKSGQPPSEWQKKARAVEFDHMEILGDREPIAPV